MQIVPLGLGVFLAAMDQTVVASSYASIGSELKQLQSTSWVATGYMLTLTSFQPLYGKLSDIFGRKQCLLFAFSVFGVGCLFCGLARNMKELIGARAIQGLGGAGISTVITILVSDVVPLRSRGTWQGVLNIIFATGAAVGAPLGGILADGIGWRWAFLLQVPMTSLAFIIIFFAFHLPGGRDHQTDLMSKLRRIDFLGAFTLVCGVLSLLVGLDRGGNVSWREPITVISLSISFVFLAFFGLTETRLAAEPFAPARVLAHSSLIAAYLCNLFCIAAAISVVFNVALYLQAASGASAAQAGLGLVPSVLGGVTGSLGCGLIMQRTGKYYWLTVGMYVAQFVGTVVLTAGTLLKKGSIGIGVVEAGLVVQALGNGAGVTTTLIAIIANAAPEDQAIATAISYLFRSMGSVLGISIGSTLVQNTLRKYLHERLKGHDVDVDEIADRARSSLASLASLPPKIQDIVRGSYAEAIRSAFIFSVVLAALALVSSFFIREKPLVRKST
ncbi:MFS general substrate transporter [Fomitiporia mediterranea MF3/22]|uniref:MFS general substrate transporter n=1 Tax=Fomitiporia mediterranea (strain MF3/22) TaxID=694068 RepID=UPI00044077D9|nr:MFS general substrate transporter [Fomitiporia mediterranea MF3/22]EJD00158.1 MFS general substrate transporter [Fomitiporia mediterranea MF3/22]